MDTPVLLKLGFKRGLEVPRRFEKRAPRDLSLLSCPHAMSKFLDGAEL